MPSLIDGHNHVGLVNIRDGSNTKANCTRANLIRSRCSAEERGGADVDSAIFDEQELNAIYDENALTIIPRLAQA